jgi:hypothetical protein
MGQGIGSKGGAGAGAAHGEVILKARVGRLVDGMDLDLFSSALKVRREFEQEMLSKREVET